MAAFPASLEQYVSASYSSYNNSDNTIFDYKTRDRLKLKSEITMGLEIRTDKVGLNTFETWYYEDLDGGVNSFTPGSIGLGSMNVVEYRMIDAPTVSAAAPDIFTINFNIRPTSELLRYNTIQECPMLPRTIVFPTTTLYPCE